MPHNVFVGPIAESYDDDSREMFDPGVLEPAVSFLADAAQGGRALEFGIGTGRVALPLSQRGIEVHGIDISADMLSRLQSKPGSEHIEVTRGDFATTKVRGAFSLVYLVFNVISNLTSQHEQVECICNAAAHLGPLGQLVIELWIPDLRRFPPNAVALPFEVSGSRVGFDTIDTATQQLVSHHYVTADDRLRVFESSHRYVWPSELDLMARIAGLRLRERWAYWDRSAFTSDSGGHISVWERAS